MNNNIIVQVLVYDDANSLPGATVFSDNFIKLRVKAARGGAFPNGPLPRSGTDICYVAFPIATRRSVNVAL